MLRQKLWKLKILNSCKQCWHLYTAVLLAECAEIKVFTWRHAKKAPQQQTIPPLYIVPLLYIYCPTSEHCPDWHVRQNGHNWEIQITMHHNTTATMQSYESVMLLKESLQIFLSLFVPCLFCKNRSFLQRYWHAGGMPCMSNPFCQKFYFGETSMRI
jgi:hypothetical protein